MLIEENPSYNGSAQDTGSSLTSVEIDAIGEIMNISMGSAATAISSMLDKQVMITTPRVSERTLDSINYHTLEPAMSVKITYVEGITGSNVMVFRQRDMQMILNQLMGIDEPPRDDFVFDELSMSAACEVMNQMMGASATALSEFLGRTINISTPTATIMDEENTFQKAVGVQNSNEKMILIEFDLTISDTMKSEFVSILTYDLAKMIVGQLMSGQAQPEPLEETITPVSAADNSVPPQTPQNQPSQQPVSAPPNPQQTPQMPPMPPQSNGMPQTPPMYGMDQNGQFPQTPPPYAYPGYPPYGYPMYPPMYPPMQDNQAQGGGVLRQPVNVQNVQFPDFSNAGKPNSDSITGGNIDLIMNVPLSVTIEIGKTKKKIKDILDFSQGTVIELDKQAGAPVDIVVNGQLIARGDVVVIDDNFGVRVSEIVGTKEILNTVTGKQ